jgi:predicted GIY-YIG superfamily endonuclease
MSLTNGSKRRQIGRRRGRRRPRAPLHHVIYVIELKDQDGPGTTGLYVGMTGLTREERFARHKAGKQAARIVRQFGVRLAPEFYEHIRPMSYEDALAKEQSFAEELRANGHVVYGGH